MAKNKKDIEVAPGEIPDGVDIRNTALAGIDGTLVAVDAARGLNLRSGPHRQYDALEVLPDGAALVKMELPYGASVQGWVMVHTGQCVGWVAEKYIQPLEG